MAIFIDFLCGIALPVFLLIAGVFFSIKLRFFYILHPTRLIKETVFSGKGAFKSLCIALGGTLGIGNIIGVGSAIAMGGYGAVFWMIVSAFLAMSVKYAEVYLAMKSKRKGKNGFFGGASYYIYDGFKNLVGENFAFFLGSIFALFCVINSFTTGNLVQINAVSNLLPINKIIFGLIFALFSFIIVSKGVKSIGFANSVIIPTLTLFYFILCTVLLIINREKIPLALSQIIKGAFSPSCMFFGVSGYGISTAIRYGFTRGLLSNEAGCGTSPSAHASSNAPAHTQSCLGIFEVFVDTVVLCTLTALVIIISGIIPSSDGAEFVLAAFYSLSGNLGKFGVLASCMLFALATICTQYFYGIESLSFITHKRAMKTAFKILFFLIIIFGALLPIKIMWQISDIALSVMTILNLTCILILNKKVAK